MPEAIASVIGGGMQASASKKAAKTAAEAQLEAARMQQEAAREALGLGREQFEYGQEQDLYQRALQRQAAQQQAEIMNENIQPFINLGLGSLGGLSQMVNPTMQIDPGLYELAGMQQQQATNIGPTFDPSEGHGGITPINFDEMDEFIQQQLEARRQAQAAQQQAQQSTTGVSNIPTTTSKFQSPAEKALSMIAAKASQPGGLSAADRKLAANIVAYQLPRKRTGFGGQR